MLMWVFYHELCSFRAQNKKKEQKIEIEIGASEIDGEKNRTIEIAKRKSGHTNTLDDTREDEAGSLSQVSDTSGIGMH